MKKTILILFFTGLCVTAFAQNKSDFEFNPEGGIITGYTGFARDVVIPERIDGVTVTAIGNSVFKDKNLNSVSIPDNVKNIGPHAFAGNKLERIVIGNEVDMMTSAFSPEFINKYLLDEPRRAGGTYAFRDDDWDYTPEGIRYLTELPQEQQVAPPPPPINIVIHNYVGKPQPGQLVEGAMPPDYPAGPSVSLLPPSSSPAPSAAQPPSRQTVGNATVMPGLPDPNTNKKYRLQVGAFTDQNAAAHTFRSLQDAGFSPIYEHSQNFYRVIIADVPASSVASTIQRLVSIGISQIWVRE
jgi:hypothetical protein